MLQLSSGSRDMASGGVLGCFSVSRWFEWMCQGWSDVLVVRELNLLLNHFLNHLNHCSHLRLKLWLVRQLRDVLRAEATKG